MNKKKDTLQEQGIASDMLGAGSSFFGSLFKLHFLQSVFRGTVEGWDPEQEEWDEAQKALPGLKKMLATHDGNAKKCARDPKCQARLAGIMGDMPDSLQSATKEAFAKDAASQLEETQEALLDFAGSIGDARSELLKIVVGDESLDDAQKTKVGALYDKIAIESTRQIVGMWNKFLTGLEKNKDKLPDYAAKKVDSAKFMGSPLIKSLTQGSLEEEEISDPYGVGTIGGPRETTLVGLPVTEQDDKPMSDEWKKALGDMGVSDDDSDDASASPEPDKTSDDKKPDQKSKIDWEQEVFKSVNAYVDDLGTELETLAGYVSTKEYESPFGVPADAVLAFIKQFDEAINRLQVALFKRLPNMVARLTGTKERKPGQVAPGKGTARPDAERVEKVRKMVARVESLVDKNQKDTAQEVLQAIKDMEPRVAAAVAKKFGMKLQEERRVFYESFGDFS